MVEWDLEGHGSFSHLVRQNGNLMVEGDLEGHGSFGQAKWESNGQMGL